MIPDKIDNQHKGVAAEEAAAVEAAAKASADIAVLTAEDEAIFRACTFTSPMLFKRAWLRCCASKTVDELLALTDATTKGNGSHALPPSSWSSLGHGRAAIPSTSSQLTDPGLLLIRRRSAGVATSNSLLAAAQV